FRESPAGEPAHVESLDCDRVESPHEAQRDLVVMVEPRATDPIVQGPERNNSLPEALASAFAARDRALRAPELRLRSLVVPWIRDLFPGRERRECADADIHTDARSGRRQRLSRRVVAAHAGVPVAVSTERNGDLLEPTLHRSVKLDLDLSDSGKVDPLPVGTEANTVAVASVLEDEGRVSTIASETREARFLSGLEPAEECAERSVETSDRVLQQVGVDTGVLVAVGAHLTELSHLR